MGSKHLPKAVLLAEVVMGTNRVRPKHISEERRWRCLAEDLERFDMAENTWWVVMLANEPTWCSRVEGGSEIFVEEVSES